MVGPAQTGKVIESNQSTKKWKDEIDFMGLFG